MNKSSFTTQAGTTAVFCAMLYLFFTQAKVALNPISVHIDGTQVAYGYSDVTFTGTVYTDEGTTNIGAGKNVTVVINGSTSQTDDTDSSGVYTLSGLTVNSSDVAIFYLDNETEDGATSVIFGTFTSASRTGIDIYQDRLIVRNDGTTPTDHANSNLVTHSTIGDSDVTAILAATNASDASMSMAPHKELYVWSGDTYTPGGPIYAHDIEVQGTLSLSTNVLTVSGSLATASGTLSTTGTIKLAGTGSETFQPGNTTTLQHLEVGSQAGTSYSVLSNLDIDGNLTIQTGSLVIGGTNAYSTALAGNWTNNAGASGFDPGNGTVQLNGTSQSITGSNKFYNFSKTVSSSDTLTLQASATQMVSGSLVIRGSSPNALNIRSSITDTAANLMLDVETGTQTIDWLNVQDSNATGGQTLVCLTDSENCTNSGNNTNWRFNALTSLSGKLFSDEGNTPLTSQSVTLMVSGIGTGSTITNGTGDYSFEAIVADGVVVTIYSSGAIFSTVANGSDITANLFADRVIISHENGGTYSSTHLATGLGVTEPDIATTVTVNSDAMALHGERELLVWPGATFSPGRDITSHDLEVEGTLAMSTNNVTLSGSLVATGSITSSGLFSLIATNSGEILSISGTSLNNLSIDMGLEAYYRFDEGTGLTASSSTLNMSTGATLNATTLWAEANTGTTLFFNPHAIELDGIDDTVTAGDAFDLIDSSDRTFSLWFRRKSATSEDVLFAKKAASGATNIGYILYIDDQSDKLVFEVANGTNNYTVTSTSAITDENWHHAAVSWDGDDVNDINIFLDGTINTISKAGSLPSGGSITATLSNALDFIVGSNGNSTAPFHGTIDELRIYKQVLSGAQVSALATGNKTFGSGTYVLGSNLDVRGDLGIYAGILDVSSNNYDVTVGGDLSVYGLLRTNSGSVYLDGTTQALNGSTHFQELNKSMTTTSTLTFESNTQQTISGSIALNGAVTKDLTIVSSRTGSQAYLVHEAARAQLIQFVNVKDNNAGSGQTMTCTTGCTNSLNNINWAFNGECGDGVVNDGEACDDGNSSNADSCLNTCVLPTCGDGFVWAGVEQCEPPGAGSCQNNCLFLGAGGGGGGSGNGSSGSSGSATSYYKRPPPPQGCGNGIFEEEKGEECDEGARFNGLGSCSYNCKKLYCGDGVVSPQIREHCEPTQKGTDRNGHPVYEVGTCGLICTAPERTPQGTLIGGCRQKFLPSCDQPQHSSAATSRPRRPAICGNGVVDAGEACDFGGVCEGGQFDGSLWTDQTSAETCQDSGGTPVPKGGDGCSATCTVEFCGDGVIQPKGADNQSKTVDDETCDNGSICSNNANVSCLTDSDCGADGTCEYDVAKNRACLPSCQRVVCGDGAVQGYEQCDDGNTDDNDGCSANCKDEAALHQSASSCGNGIVESNEACDDGNALDGDGCSSSCSTEEVTCGNGIVEDNEECDDGAANSDVEANACRTNCTQARCGDFVIDQFEECDSGTGNGNQADGCRHDCRQAYCGDGVVDSSEQCDGSLGCSPSCRLPLEQATCGNGIVETGEQCDDNNRVSGDGCSRFCQKEQTTTVQHRCGDGVQSATEQCDDGNDESGDGCSSDCQVEKLVKPKRQAPVAAFTINADVVIVNPTEYATALEFVGDFDPCSVLVIKGKDQKAELIREAANQQGIPIIQHIQLARALYKNIRPGDIVSGELCPKVHQVKKQVEQLSTRAKIRPVQRPQVSKRVRVRPSAPIVDIQPTLPTTTVSQPVITAQLQPILLQQPLRAETGPTALVLIASGAASGLAIIRRKRR